MNSSHGGKSFRCMLLALSALALIACETVQTTQGGAVGVGRQQRMMVSSDQMETAARQQYAEVIAAERQKGMLNRNEAQLYRMRAIANRLIAQTQAFRGDARQWQWEVNLITSPQVNAWCMPGGKVAVYSGLLDKLQPTDDEAAAVLGHEMAHALREHARERASERIGTDILSAGAEIIGALYGIQGAGRIADAGLQLGIGLPNSREHETEADRIGVELAARAGYNPQAAVTLWQKMARAGGGETLKFLSTHPPRAEREADLLVYSQRVMPLYEQARKR